MTTNYDWYIEQDLSKFSGKWVVIIDQKIIGSGNKVNELIQKAQKEYPTKTPFIAKINNKLSIL